MKRTICAECGAKVAQSGRFRYRPGKGDYVCVGGCQPAEKPRNGTHANWPLVTSHVGDPNNGPMEIQNLSHLRRVEKEYGVSSGAYSYDRSNQ